MSDAAWKLVPVEPDRRMCRDGAYEVSGVTAAGAEAIYRAMVLTAPEPPEPAAGGVRVRELEWTAYGADQFAAQSIAGRYAAVKISTRAEACWWRDSGATVDAPNLEAAKAAAQADYTARITAALEPAPSVADMAAEIARAGIYIASKTKHADKWRALRAAGEPIISTWIDEAGQGETSDFDDLWRRCISEPARAAVLIAYCEPGDVLKGGWVEIGAALSSGTPVFGVGLREFTIGKSSLIRHFDTMDAAIAAARAALKGTTHD